MKHMPMSRQEATAEIIKIIENMQRQNLSDYADMLGTDPQREGYIKGLTDAVLIMNRGTN